MPQASFDPHLCPCERRGAQGKPLAYAQCCAPCIEGRQPAQDAESLMRSRYSAYVRGDTAYLRQTWHPSTRPSELTLDRATRWLGLQVRAHRVMDETHAQVEFVARSRSGGQAATRQHERSRFVREDGIWFYVDGDRL